MTMLEKLAACEGASYTKVSLLTAHRLSHASQPAASPAQTVPRAF